MTTYGDVHDLDGEEKQVFALGPADSRMKAHYCFMWVVQTLKTRRKAMRKKVVS